MAQSETTTAKKKTMTESHKQRGDLDTRNLNPAFSHKVKNNVILLQSNILSTILKGLLHFALAAQTETTA